MKDGLDAVLFLIFLTAAVGFGVFVYKDSKEHDQTCLANHHGEPFTETHPYTTTPDGCIINEISKFNGGCYFESKVYYTTCPKTVTWQRYVNKHYVTESNTTEVK